VDGAVDAVADDLVDVERGEGRVDEAGDDVLQPGARAALAQVDGHAAVDAAVVVDAEEDAATAAVGEGADLLRQRDGELGEDGALAVDQPGAL